MATFASRAEALAAPSLVFGVDILSEVNGSEIRTGVITGIDSLGRLAIRYDTAERRIAELEQETVKPWKPGNQSKTVVAEVGSYVGTFYIRPGGDTTADPSDYDSSGPENWQADLERYSEYDSIMSYYYDTGITVRYNNLKYHGQYGGDYNAAPTGVTDVNWVLEDATEVVVSNPGVLGMQSITEGSNVTQITIPNYTGDAGIIIGATFDGFGRNGNITDPGYQLAGYTPIAIFSSPSVIYRSSDTIPNIALWWKIAEASDIGSIVAPSHLSDPNICRGLVGFVVSNMTGVTANNVDAHPSETAKSVGAAIAGSMSLIMSSQTSTEAGLNDIPGFTEATGAVHNGHFTALASSYRLNAPDDTEPSVVYDAPVRSIAIMLNIQ